MRVEEAVRRITFKIGTLDDVGGKAINQLVYNRVIIDELNTNLNDYAAFTKGIKDVYTFPLNTNEPFVSGPPLALRSESYEFIYIIVNGTIFPIDMRGKQDALNNFRYRPIQGITNWVMPWGQGKGQFLSVFPMNGTTPVKVHLNADINPSDTTIPVSSTNGFINNEGRFTIGEEKVLFKYKDNTNFYGCTRGVEQTIPAFHTMNDLVTANNIVIYYSRLPIKIEMTDRNFIDPATLNREIEVVEEHMEGIIKKTAYEILIKVDPARSTPLKMDYAELFDTYKRDIRKGYYAGRQGTGIRDPFLTSESGIPWGNNLIY
jgi:hypothetical protein